MTKQEDFRRPEKPLEKTQGIYNEAKISKKADQTNSLPSDKSLVQVCNCFIRLTSSIGDKKMDLVICLVVSCRDGINENS